MEATVTKKRHSLTRNQGILLHGWLWANIHSLRESGKTAGDAAEVASATLGFTVTESHVRNIAGMAAGCPIRHEWPGYRPVRAADAKPTGGIEARLASIEDKLDQILKVLPGPLFGGV